LTLERAKERRQERLGTQKEKGHDVSCPCGSWIIHGGQAKGHRVMRRVRRGSGCAEVFDVAVGAEADVVGQVETVVVGVCVNYDFVGAPVPIVAVAVVGGEDAEREAAEPEAFAIAAGDAPDVARAEAAAEAAVSPGMINVIADVSAAGVVADPLAVGMNVGGVGMAVLVLEIAMLVGRVSGSVMNGRRAVLGNCLMGRFLMRRRMLASFLRESGGGRNERESEYG